MLIIKDKDMRRIGALENAFHVTTERRRNEVWYASFSLPIDDHKNALCSHMNYVEITSPSDRYFGLYRIMPTQTKRNASEEYIRYECEHVIATLLDDVISGYVVYSNESTREVMRKLLDKQTVKRWQIGDVDFTRYFTYSFENENGLLAPILEIPRSFGEDYEFTYDTTVYPWRLNLVRPSAEIRSEIRWGKNMIDFNEVSDPSKIVNYIVPKGAGEGVNQLTIERVNNGRDYLQDSASIAKWGKQSYIWVDRRYTDEASLKESAQALLDKYSEPQISFEIDSVDLSVFPEYAHERKELGSVTKIIVGDSEYLARINGEIIDDLFEDEWDASYEIGENIDDISDAQAEIERSIEVNERYAQGATNILTFGYQDNADSGIPAVIPFYIDDDVVNVNTCELTFRTKPFRAYSRATEGGGAVVKSTSSGGGTTATSSSGGGTSRSTSSGGGSTRTSSSGGGTSRSTASGGGGAVTSGQDNMSNISTSTSAQQGSGTSHYHELMISGASLIHTHSVSVPSHTHSFTVPSHTHSIDIPNHSHDFTVPNHTHSVNIPNHSHEIEIPNHTHEVKHEIIELSSTPSSVSIKVDGNKVSFDGTRADRLNLIDYIKKESNGKITRGRHEIEILPSGLARIEADLILRVFIQSHLGGTY